MPILTDHDQVQQDLVAGDWDILYGETITELDALTFVISIPTGTTAAWLAERLEAQLAKFAQSATDISPEVVAQAVLILEGILEGKWLGKWDIEGLQIKAGMATYHRWWQFVLCGWRLGGKKKLMSHYQPYLGVRVAKKLPVKGWFGAAEVEVQHTDLVVMEEEEVEA